MVTSVSVSCEPEKIWQRKALAELELTLGKPLDLWTFHKDLGWSPQQASTDRSEFGLAESDAALSTLIDSATSDGRLLSREQSPGQYLFVIPLGDAVAATTTVLTDKPELLVSLANLGRRFFHQQEEMTRVREENEFFLKQVSDDFEELTFLRSMAERLGLGHSTHTLEQLVNASLPELGKSAHAEELHFVLNSAEELVILASWYSEEIDWPTPKVIDAVQLMQHFHRAAESQPMIKNGFELTEEGQNFPGVRDFIAIPVIKAESQVGWFLAINRIAERVDVAGDLPEWQLNQHEFGTSEASLLSTAAAMTASHASNLSLFQEREALLVNVVRTLVSAVEAKDPYTCGHSERVALYGKRLAEKIGYDDEACELLYLTGLLHDIGKIAINDAILNKPDRLTDEEFAEIQRHPDEGWKILHELQQLAYVLPGVLHHHERFDGKGYPDGLAECDIPLDGRVLAVADAYDAMTSDRAYRMGMPHEKAIGILREGAGTQWDPTAIEAFLEIEPEIVAIRESYRPREQPRRVPTPASSHSL